MTTPARPVRALSEITKAELKKAILDYVRAEGPSEGRDFPHRVARELGADMTDARSLGLKPGEPTYGHYATRAKSRYLGQVARAANELVDSGELRKVGKGERRPCGRTASNTAWYYTDSQWAKAEAEAKERAVRTEEAQERWRDVRKRLLLGPGVTLDDHHKLSLGDWETVLNSAGW